MSRARLSCPNCGSANIVEDDLYCQTQTVCVDCGSVVSEGALANDPVGGTEVHYNQTTAVDRKPCMNLRKGLQRVKAICRILRVHKEIEDLSHTNFNKAYQHESFLRVSLQKKEVLAGCCVLVSCRLLNWPVTMLTVSCLLDADPMLVGGVYQEMIKVLNIEAPTFNITDVMEAHAQEYKLSSSQVPEEFAETSKDLTKRAVALVELAADCWIVTGRKPVPIMMAAIFLAWQSLKPSKLRLKFSLDKFCQFAKVNKHQPALKRIAEMKEMLCKLGQEIPWLREEVTPNNVVQQVEDILKHRYALLRRVLRNHEDAAPAENSFEDSEEPEEPQGASPDPERTQQAADGDQCSAPELQSNATESNWGKRVLFAPPCVIHAKRRRTEQPELQDVTGDEEISDSEIDSYIRTPREARDFALAQETLCTSERS